MGLIWVDMWPSEQNSIHEMLAVQLECSLMTLWAEWTSYSALSCFVDC